MSRRDKMLVEMVIHRYHRPVRDGMWLLFNRFENISLIIFDAEIFQKFNIFRSHISLFMVLGLIDNILYYTVQLRFAIRKCAITFLPRETPCRETLFVYPFGRFAFYGFIKSDKESTGRIPNRMCIWSGIPPICNILCPRCCTIPVMYLYNSSRHDSFINEIRFCTAKIPWMCICVYVFAIFLSFITFRP